MAARGSGHIVAISSVAGRVGPVLRTGYAAAKHGLIGYCDALRAEVETAYGIKVTTILPGSVRTRVAANALQGDGSAARRLRRQYRRRHGPRRMRAPDPRRGRGGDPRADRRRGRRSLRRGAALAGPGALVRSARGGRGAAAAERATKGGGRTRRRSGFEPRPTSTGSWRRRTASIREALAELRRGRKQSHWMWFVFPQLAGLGRSATARSTASPRPPRRAPISPIPCSGRACANAPRPSSPIAERSAEAIFGADRCDEAQILDDPVRGGGRGSGAVRGGAGRLLRRRTRPGDARPHRWLTASGSTSSSGSRGS